MISPQFLTRRVTLQRPTVVKDAAGGATRPTWAAVPGAVDLPAGVQPASAADVALFAARQVTVTHAVYVETDPGFRRGDQLVTDDGRTFTVNGWVDVASAGRLYQAFCREVME